MLILIKTVMSVNSIVIGRTVASGADGIPLDAFTAAGAQTVIALFAIWGLAHLVICGLCLLALLRYRALVPFMFALLLFEHFSRKLILYFLPIPHVAAVPGSVVNLLLPALMIVGLALSVLRRNNFQPQI